MRLKGGYNVYLKGQPALEVKKLPKPDTVLLPLYSKRFDFKEVCIKEGETVKQGQVLAKDPDNYDIPLLAPCSGTVKINDEGNHIIIEDPAKGSGEAVDIESGLPEGAKERGEEGKKLYTLLRLGAWSFLSDAFTGGLPDPFKQPQAVIIPVAYLEPYLTDSEVLLNVGISGFKKGIEYLCSVTKDAPIYLVLPKKKAGYAAEIKDLAKNNSRLELIPVPPKYPYDNPKLIAQKLDLVRDASKGAVWTLRTQGVLAVNAALSTSIPVVNRIISISGPGAKIPGHVECFAGYPLKEIYDSYKKDDLVRVINGGIMTGDFIAEAQEGIDVECQGLTLLPEHTKREFLAFAHLGITKRYFSHTAVSSLLPPFKEAYTTGVRGELRPCLSCGFCEQACPARIIPHLVHKNLDKDRLEQAIRFGLTLCVQCGLCSLVCPSKIENKQALFEGQQKIKQKLKSKEVQE